jgi:SNF2 family DNA or RNA helicase
VQRCFARHDTPMHSRSGQLQRAHAMQIRCTDASRRAHVVLTSYEFLINKKDVARLSAQPWHYLILDEGHRIKNAECQLSRVLRTYKIRHKLLLTGTPLQNDLSELWSLLNFLVRASIDRLPARVRYKCACLERTHPSSA